MTSIRSRSETRQQHELFTMLKKQVISIGTALYGTNSTTPESAFDLIVYTLPSPRPAQASSTDPPPSLRYGVVLIAYTSPTSFSSWEIISRAEGQRDVISAAEALLNDLRAGMGNALYALDQKEQSKVVHKRVLDMAMETGGETLKPIEKGGVERKMAVESADVAVMVNRSEEMDGVGECPREGWRRGGSTPATTGDFRDMSGMIEG